ncbi:MAG: RNA methyltransferase [Erysipelotrichaceae bacterium]|nr:RNA methyltransferase [Erysipelotrichaceae bacterium]
MIIEGAIAVKAAINFHKRNIDCVYINANKKTKDFNYIRKIGKINNIPFKEVGDDVISSLAIGKSHGGILAEVSNRFTDEFVDGDIFYLDGIEDPFNLGYALRTLYAFGIKNVLLSNRDYSMMEAQLLKSSAGAYDMLNIKICKNPLVDLKTYKDAGYYLYSLYRGEDSKDVFDEAFKDNALFILGGEKRGISSDILAMCDEHLYISYGSDFRNSLNACAALDVVVTLLYKQRRTK